MTALTRLSVTGRLVLTPVSPVCIGSGERLGPVDLSWHAGQLTVKDVPKWLADPTVPLQRKTEAVERGDSSAVTAIRYRLRAVLRRPPQEMICFAKDCHGRPYVPASSVKGAIRTALACQLTAGVRRGAPERLSHALATASRSRRESTAQELNGLLFGKSATTDFLKLLTLRDSAPLDLSGLRAYECRLVGSARPLTFLVEALAPDPAARVEIAFSVDVQRAGEDEGLRSRRAAEKLSPDTLQKALRLRGQALLQAERAFFARFQTPEAKALVSLYSDLDAGAGGAALLPVGYGTGWTAKTVGLMLESAELDSLRISHRLGREGHPFPKTRKLVVGADGRLLPLGWFRVEVQA